MDKKTSNYITVLLVTIFLLSLTSTSFSYMRVSLEQKGEDKVTDIVTATVDVRYIQPKTWYMDDLNKENEYTYNFGIYNTSNKEVTVLMNLNNLEDNLDVDDDIILHIYKNEEEIYGTNKLEETFELKLEGYEEDNYTLKLEINSIGESKYIHSEVQITSR